MDKARILFVDDNQDILDGLKRALRHEKRRWDLFFINSGESALEFMSANRIDAVVTDIRMPGVDGVRRGSYLPHDENLERHDQPAAAGLGLIPSAIKTPSPCWWRR